MNIIESIKVIVECDQSPDLSYLDADNDPEYAEENAERLADYGNGWYMVGVYCQAVVYTPTPQGGFKGRQTIDGGGLWGIESDSDKSYLLEVAQDNMAELKITLADYNVCLDNFDELAAAAIDAM